MRTKYFAFAILAILALAVSACGPTTVNQAAPEAVRTLNVSGVGIVYLTPDIVYINIGVNTQRENAAQSVEVNKEQTNAVIAAIKEFGVDAKDIRTTNFSIWSNPQYDPSGQVTGTMYVVDNTVNVTVRDLEKLGDLLDAAVAAGANSIYSIQFDVEDKTEANKEARNKAVEDAKVEAQELADASGVALAEIQSINYFESSPTPYFEGKGGGGGAAVESAVPIQPGQLAISVTVNITYFIK
ncbi:MAG: SIMPL domain-containing protein [Anaerolineales bacterium]|nr:SIMPL domain-containing protein [Anaerolineales bacterium]